LAATDDTDDGDVTDVDTVPLGGSPCACGAGFAVATARAAPLFDIVSSAFGQEHP